MPRCTRDGEFERLQCQCVENKAARIKACRTRGHGCWCADLQGNKIPGTVKADAQYTDCVTGKCPVCGPGARCSSVVRAFAHGAMGRRIDPSWGGPIELFLVSASASRLV